MQKKFIVICAAIILSLAVFSCGPKGDSGVVGPTGLPGAGCLVANFQEGVYPDSSYAGCVDGRLREDSATVNYGTATILQLGVSAISARKRGNFKFDISDELTGVVVEDAYLTVYATDIYSGSHVFALYEFTTGWVETQATWNVYSTGNLWTAAGGDFNAAAISDSVNINAVGYHTFRINASVVQKWIDDETSNKGIMMKITDESVIGDLVIAMSEHTTGSFRPRLTVYYTAP